MSRLSVDEFDDLLAGSQLGVLSAANTFPGEVEAWVRELLREHGPLELVDPAEVRTRFHDGAMGATVGMVGSLTALLEIPPQGDEPVRAVRALEAVTGHRFAGLAALNAAGPNALLVVAAACLLDLPLLDCDGQGRVMPIIDQTTYVLGGVDPAPLAGVGPWGDVVTIQSQHDRAEALTRAAVTASGGWLLTAMYPAPLARLAATGISHAMTRCVQSGTTLRSGARSLGERLARELGGRLLGRGRVLAIEQHGESGTKSRQPAQPLSILIENERPMKGSVRLEVRNEVVLVTVDGVVAGTVPDTVCLLDPLRRRTVDLLDLTQGDVMEILLLPASPLWHTPAGRKLAGPTAFGLPIRDGNERW